MQERVLPKYAANVHEQNRKGNQKHVDAIMTQCNAKSLQKKKIGKD
jgi:hypothetical protein